MNVPKKELAIFVGVDLVLVVAMIVAVFHHVPVFYAMMAFIVLSVINGIFLIVFAVRSTGMQR
ncbi:MAG TPA: hypothetical protein VFQ00_11360 [Terriglobales bacterium]|nr:hypothetical protein [Terriglobales bacterium]